MNLGSLFALEAVHVFYASLGISLILFAEAAYLLFASDDSGRKRINRRMAISHKAKGISQKDILVQLRKERGLDAEGNFVLQARWLNRLIVQAGLNVTLGRALAILTGLVVVAEIALLLTTRSMLLAAVMLPVFGLLIPWIYLRMRRRRKLVVFGKQLPEAIDLITRSLKAGHPVPVAISMVAREMPDPIGSEFGMVADEVTYGSDLVTALMNLYQRVGHPDLPLLVSSVSIQSTTGGNLREILSGLSMVIRGRLKMKSKIRAISAEGRMSAMFLTAMPVMLLGVLMLLMPDYYAGIWGFVHSWYGAAGLVTWLVSGNLMILKMVSFKV